MTLRLSITAVLSVLLMGIGCNVAEVPNSTASSPKYEIPEPFQGQFNPTGLQVGTDIDLLAPEITGNDIDGIEFKLSDYRGKVVMLDFWGDW